MRVIISLVLALVVAFLAYMLYTNIKEPISFHAEKEVREGLVQDKLEQIREAQKIYKDITGQYAHNFDTLSSVLRNDSIEFVKFSGDPDAGIEIVKTFSYTPAIDSVRALGINLDSLKYVPYNQTGSTFSMSADTITYQQTLVHVCEVSTRYSEFMGKYSDSKYGRFDNLYKPSNRLKIGDMSKPTLNGNW